MKKSNNALKSIREGSGKEIARAYFVTYTTQEAVSRKIYPHSHNQVAKKKLKYIYVQPTVKRKCAEWKKEGFFDLSIPQKKLVYRKGRKQYQSFKLSLLNFEPLYRFCKEEKGIEFEEAEKSYLNELLLPEHYRKLILQEYPEEDIIQATLKFYVKYLKLQYDTLLRDREENPKKYESVEIRKNELNNPQDEELKKLKNMMEKTMRDVDKKLNISYKKSMELTTMNLIANDLLGKAEDDYFQFLKDNKLGDASFIQDKAKIYSSLPPEKKPFFVLLYQRRLLHTLFFHYTEKIKNIPHTVMSVDRKIMSALGL
jgi:hypothetical protein